MVGVKIPLIDSVCAVVVGNDESRNFVVLVLPCLFKVLISF